MKKSLIALAVLAASGAAMAQSSVTLYGRVDASFGSEKDTVTGLSQTKLFNGSAGGLTGSRWGLKGTEDLGGGLSASFVLEQRFNIDDGKITSASGLAEGFNGDAYLALNGGFGSVQMGRSYTAYDGIKALSVGSSVFDSAFTPTAQPSYTVRAANQIKYVSPSFGGLTVAGSVALKESNAVGAKNTSSLTATYKAGALAVGAGFENSATGDNTMVSGSYDFGVASISGGYGTFDADGAGDDASGFNLGVTVPYGAFKFSAGIADGKTETKAGTKVTDISGYGLGVTYSLSKRTTAYAGFKDTKTKNAAGTKTAGTRLYAVGIRHDF